MDKKIGIKEFFLWIGKVTIAGTVTIFILSIFSYIYDYSGIHIQNKKGGTDYIWQSNQYKSTMKEGFSWLSMDENGFNNNHIAKDHIDILLMGSSHMEAVNIKQNQNVGYLLNDLIPQYYTYNIGISGHTIYRCVNNIESAIDNYKPSRYVIIETDSIELKIKEMDAVVKGTAKAIPSYDSGMIYYLQKIPAFKSIYNQLDIWMNEEATKGNNKETDKENQNLDEYRKKLREFLAIVSNSAQKSEIKPIIFFSPTEKIGKDGVPTYVINEQYLEIFKETCKELDITFIDMTNTFKQLYNEQHVTAHGFSNTAVGVGHLNEFGHKAISNTIAKIISELEV